VHRPTESRVDADRWSRQRFTGRLGEWPFCKPHRRRKKKAWAIAAAKETAEERPPHFAYATNKHLRLLDCSYMKGDCAALRARRMPQNGRSKMGTNLKVILAAIGIAVLTSPVMAETLRHTHAPLSTDLSTDNAFARAKRDRAPDGVRPAVTDCVRVAFPQCGASWRRARHIHKQHHNK
jgi:hypothetical protein